jgi:hypothetical protein
MGEDGRGWETREERLETSEERLEISEILGGARKGLEIRGN